MTPETFTPQFEPAFAGTGSLDEPDAAPSGPRYPTLELPQQPFSSRMTRSQAHELVERHVRTAEQAPGLLLPDLAGQAPLADQPGPGEAFAAPNRPYASPWMRQPRGSIDPRPLQPPSDEPVTIAPSVAIMPRVGLPTFEDVEAHDQLPGALPPLPKVPAAPEVPLAAHVPLPAVVSIDEQLAALKSAILTPEPEPEREGPLGVEPQISAEAAAESPAPVAAEPPPVPTAASGDPLSGVFGLPAHIEAAAADPQLWFASDRPDSKPATATGGGPAAPPTAPEHAPAQPSGAFPGVATVDVEAQASPPPPVAEAFQQMLDDSAAAPGIAVEQLPPPPVRQPAPAGHRLPEIAAPLAPPVPAPAPPSSAEAPRGALRRWLPRAMAITALVSFLAAPALGLLSPTTPYSFVAHGIGAMLFMGVATMMVHGVFPVLRGARRPLARLQRMAGLTALLAVANAICGAWVLDHYLASGGARERLLASAPALHDVAMQFKLFVGMFPLPLLVAGWIATRSAHASSGRLSDGHRWAIAIGLAGGWIYMAVVFALGLGISMVQPA